MKTSLWFSWIIFITAITSLLVAVFRSEPVSIEWGAFLVGVLGTIVTTLIGWQIYKSIEINSILRRVKSAEQSVKDVEYMLYATSEQISGAQYKGKSAHHELWHYMLALEYLNKATNAKYENLIKEIWRLACGAPFTILDKSRLISALCKLNSINPDIIPWVMKRTEVEQDSRVWFNKKRLKLAGREINLAGFSTILGLMLAAGLMAFFFYLSYDLIIKGQEVLGGIFGAVDVCGLLSVLSKFQMRKNKN